MSQNRTSFETISNTTNQIDLEESALSSPSFFPIMLMILANSAILISCVLYQKYNRKLDVTLAQHGHSIWSSNPSRAIISKRKEYIRDANENKSCHTQNDDHQWSLGKSLCDGDGMETVLSTGYQGSDAEKRYMNEIGWKANDTEKEANVLTSEKTQREDKFYISNFFSYISLFNKKSNDDKELSTDTNASIGI